MHHHAERQGARHHRRGGGARPPWQPLAVHVRAGRCMGDARVCTRAVPPWGVGGLRSKQALRSRVSLLPHLTKPAVRRALNGRSGTDLPAVGVEAAERACTLAHGAQRNSCGHDCHGTLGSASGMHPRTRGSTMANRERQTESPQPTAHSPVSSGRQ